MQRKQFLRLSLAAGFTLPVLSGGCVSAAKKAYLYPAGPDFQRGVDGLRKRGLLITDFHIHIRGGMTPQKAAARERQSGIRSAVLENFGREWPLTNSRELAAFIDSCQRVRVNQRPLPVGIQVNDRDWHTQIDRSTFERLDYVLADTMIMGVTAAGLPRRLWKEDVTIDNPEAWMEEYLRHNLAILDEPVTILANPTYLPACIAPLYDTLWSDERMQLVIAKAVKNRVALEIQAESHFPKPRFLKIARSMGARFSFGSNNFTDQTKDLSRWFEAIEMLDLRPSDILT